MRSFAAVLVAASLAALAAGQDKLSKEEAGRYARLCVEALGTPADAQVATDAEPGEAVAVRGEGGGRWSFPRRG